LTSLSIVIPAFNEEVRLPSTLRAVCEYLMQLSPEFWEVLIVDDGSRDGTAAVVEQWCAAHPGVRLLRNPENCGKGYSVRKGVLAARGAWILSTDADLSAPIAEFKVLYRAAEETKAHVAIGSRALDRSLVGAHQSIFREYSGRAFNLVMRLITGLPFRDTQCGFKLFEANAAREVFSRQILTGFSFDVEDLVIAQRLRFRIVEVPIRWNNVAGSKVSTTQGIKSFADLLAIRLNDLRNNYR
jgi:dolichyl-phosphate beta-glucosyltransferase